MTSVHSEQCSAYGAVSLQEAGYVKAGESIGRSDLTELLKRDHAYYKEKSIGKEKEKP